MDQFGEQAQRLNIRSTILTGATFGIFLMVGQAWSSLTGATADAILPDRDGLLNEALKTLFSSVFGAFLLAMLFRVDACCNYGWRRREVVVVRGGGTR